MSQPTVEPRAVVPPYNWRVPVLGDVPNIPSDLTNLASDIAGTVGAVVSASGAIAGTPVLEVETAVSVPTVLVNRGTAAGMGHNGTAITIATAGNYFLVVEGNWNANGDLVYISGTAYDNLTAGSIVKPFYWLSNTGTGFRLQVGYKNGAAAGVPVQELWGTPVQPASISINMGLTVRPV